MTPKQRIIYDDYHTKRYEEWAKEELLENGYVETKEEITDDMLMDRIYEMMNWDWDDVKRELDNIFTEDHKYWTHKHRVLVFGEVGRWDGVSSGFQTFDNIEEAISWMLGDCYNAIVYDENGHLHFTNLHHDGRCNYEVVMLTDEGWEHFDKWNYGEINRSVGEILTELVNEYSILPRYCEKAWGAAPEEYEDTKQNYMNIMFNKATSFYS